MNWNKWIRQTHRWLSMAFTLAVIINIVAIALKKYTNTMGLLAVVPLALQFVTGLYLFVLPYATKWRSARHRLNAAVTYGCTHSSQKRLEGHPSFSPFESKLV